MPIYNLIQYSDNYSKTPGLLWQNCRDEPALDANNAITYSNGDSTGDNGRTDVETIISLKYLINLWITLEMLLSN